MKKKTMAFVMSLLMIVALVGVGFATWVITADTKEEAKGNITVDSVVDTRIGVKAEWGTYTAGTFTGLVMDGFTDNTGANKVVFGAPANPTEGWLQNDTASTENLDLYLKITLTGLVQEVDKKTYGLSTSGLTFTLTEDSKGTAYETAKKANYVGAMPTVSTVYLCKADQQYFLSTDSADKEYTEGTDVAVTAGADQTAVIYVKLGFTWGSEFGSKNPYNYFNDTFKNPTKENIDAAKAALEGLKALDKTAFTLTITGKGAARTFA